MLLLKDAIKSEDKRHTRTAPIATSRTTYQFTNGKGSQQPEKKKKSKEERRRRKRRDKQKMTTTTTTKKTPHASN